VAEKLFFMKKEEKVNFILNTLENYFPNPKNPLNHKDPYTLLIATLLSAQSTDQQVNKVTKKLFKKASTPEEMIKLSCDEIKEIIKPCGLGPTKSKAIYNLSQELIKKHKGKVPKNLRLLEELPGVGHKTASVVLSQAFKKNTFPVDTHIKRSALRWGLSKGKTPLQIESDLKKLIPKKLWGKVHLQIIYFARRYCKARGHNPQKCPICSLLVK
jgi:endonuclease III